MRLADFPNFFKEKMPSLIFLHGFITASQLLVIKLQYLKLYFKTSSCKVRVLVIGNTNSPYHSFRTAKENLSVHPDVFFL